MTKKSLLDFASNNFEEITFYEILKYVLEQEHTKNYKLNFQSIDNARSLIKDFFFIDMDPVKDDLSHLKQIFTIRHKIIHGSYDDSKISEDMVKKAKESLITVVSFLDHEIYSWRSVAD